MYSRKRAETTRLQILECQYYLVVLANNSHAENQPKLFNVKKIDLIFHETCGFGED